MESLVHGMLSNAAVVAVLAVLIALFGRVIRRPAVIHGLCLLALLKLVTPPVVRLPMPVPAPAVWHVKPSAEPAPFDEPDLDASPIDIEPAGPAPEADDLDDPLLGSDLPLEEPAFAQMGPDATASLTSTWIGRWEPVVLALILAGAAGWWMRAAVRVVRFHRLLRDVQPMPAAWRAEVDALADRLGLRRPPMACLVPGDLPPMLWAPGPRAWLLVPAKLWGTLSDEGRTALLLHELAHLKRGDHRVRWAELAVAGLYWWHPGVCWIRRMLREAEEQCCDAWVVWAMPREARTYAAALVAALEFVSGVPTVPAVAASATLGNGHVSSLKRRLRMIVKARTPRRLTWAGRLAIACCSALLLPLAPSWAQKDDHEAKATDRPAPAAPDRDTQARYEALAAEAIWTEMQLTEAQAALHAAKAGLELTKAAQGPHPTDEAREQAVRDEFLQDPDVRPLIGEIKRSRETLEQVRRKVRQPNDPAVVAAQKDYQKLQERWEELWRRKDDEIATSLAGDRERMARQVTQAEKDVDKLKQKSLILTARLKDAQDAPSREEKDAAPRPARGRESSERLEAELKALKDKLSKDLDPLGETVRKSLDKALEDVHQALRKDGMSADDLRQAMEKARRDLSDAMRRGGMIDKQVREATEQVRKDVRDAMDKSMRESHRLTEELAARMRSAREEQRKTTERERDQRRKATEDHQAQGLRESERTREARRERTREREEKADNPDVDAARKEVRELQERLREASRRLQELQRRESRRPERTAPTARPAPPPTAARAAEPPAKPAEPRRPDRPEPPRRPVPSTPERTRERDDYERRFHDLDEKMNRLLKELEDLKRRNTPTATRAL